MGNIRIDFELLCEAFPEATKIPVLPRKKKKALKKKISKMIIALLSRESARIIREAMENSIYDETLSLMTTVSEQLDSIEKCDNK